MRIAALLVLALLTACGGSPTPEPSPAPTRSAVPVPTASVTPSVAPSVRPTRTPLAPIPVGPRPTRTSPPYVPYSVAPPTAEELARQAESERIDREQQALLKCSRTFQSQDEALFAEYQQNVREFENEQGREATSPDREQIIEDMNYHERRRAFDQQQRDCRASVDAGNY